MTALFIFQVIITLIACAGFTTIVVHGTVLDRPRAWLSDLHPVIKKLLHCSMCSGWHVGLWYGCGCLLLASSWVFWVVTLPFASSIISLLTERVFVLVDDVNVKNSPPSSEEKPLGRIFGD